MNTKGREAMNSNYLCGIATKDLSQAKCMSIFSNGF